MGCGRSKQKTVNSRKQVQNQEAIQALPTQEPEQPHFSATRKQQEGNVGFSATQLNVENKGLLRDFYKLGKVLGSGAFGEVRIATHLLTGEKRAVKIISKDSVEDSSLFFKEVTILKLCDHPNIVRIYEFFQDSKKYYLVTEYCNGGELFDKITKEVSFSELQAATYMKQIMSSVNYCHEKSIVHRDLKPENLLLESDKNDSQLKVIDFGTSTCMDPNKKLNETFGTPYYIAPEVLKGKYDEKCDIWSCGVILYILLCGYPPFNGPNDKAIIQSVMKGQVEIKGPEWQNISNYAKNLIKNMLQMNPEKRFSSKQVLEDKWFQIYQTQQNIDQPITSNALKNLKKFKADQKMQQATIMFIVQQLTTKEERSNLEKAFQLMDKNGDGKLSKKELQAGYREVFGEISDEELDKIIEAADTDGSGYVDYTEFVAASMSKQVLLSKEKLELCFKMFDKDGSGTISLEELKDILGKKGASHDEMVTKLLKEADSSGDGQIDLKEFKELMLKLF